MTLDSSQNKRKRGGQRGNQNARRHGFYSANFSSAEISQFWDILSLEDVDPEIAVLRVKLQSSLQHLPVNRRLLGEISTLLAKCYGKKYHLNRTDYNYLKTIIDSIFELYLGTSLSHPEQSNSPDE